MQFLTWGLLGSGRLPQCTSSFCARVFTTVVGLGPYGFLFIEGHPGFFIQGMWGSAHAGFFSSSFENVDFSRFYHKPNVYANSDVSESDTSEF